MMRETRIIKKYPNRRLYDLAISSYVTLNDIHKLILEDIDIQVMDVRKNEDITHSILLQIILEQEMIQRGLFSNQFLQQWIRTQAKMTPEIFRHMLEKHVEYFAALMSNKPTALEWVQVVSETQLKWWADLQKSFFSSKDSPS